MALQHGGLLFDVGNVLIDHTNTTPELVDHGDYNSIPEVVGAFEGLRLLNDQFGGNVSGIYKATDTADAKIRDWLITRDFTHRTGIPIGRVFRTANGRDKTSHISQTSLTHYGTTIVIDDRLEVLSHFVGKVPHLFLFHPQTKEIEQFKHTGALNHVHRVETWTEIRKILTK